MTLSLKLHLHRGGGTWAILERILIWPRAGPSRTSLPGPTPGTPENNAAQGAWNPRRLVEAHRRPLDERKGFLATWVAVSVSPLHGPQNGSNEGHDFARPGGGAFVL